MTHASSLRASPTTGSRPKKSFFISVITGGLSNGRLDPAFVFLALAATFGIAVLFANGPWQAADENDHFFRSFQLSEGGFISTKTGTISGGELPAMANKNMGSIPFHYECKVTREVYLKTLHPIFVNWEKEPRTFTIFPHTVVYSIATYIPQTVAIFSGRMAHIGPLGLLYLARLAGFIVSAGICYMALRLLPSYRWSALIMITCPMSLYLLGAVAPDGLLIGAAWLLLALALRAETQPITTSDKMAIIAIGSLLPLAKMVYLPASLIAVGFAVPRLNSRREQIVFVGAFAVLCIIPLAIWTHIITTVYVGGRTDITIDPSAQSHFILQHPFSFLALVARTLQQDRQFIYEWFVGTLGWGDTPMPKWYYPVFGYGFLFSVLAESHHAGKGRWVSRLLLIAAGLASVILIFMAQYMTWNPPGRLTSIEGIEGRYFLPVVPLLLAGIPALGKLKLPEWIAPVWATTMAVGGSAVCLYAVIMRYYIA